MIESDFRRRLGERVADLRLDAKLTQAEVAERICTTRTAISAIEGGTRNTSAYELVLLAEILGVSIPDLLSTPGVSVVPSRNRWTELARQIQRARLTYKQLAATSWENGNLLDAIRFRYLAEGLELAQEKQLELSKREPDADPPGNARPVPTGLG